MPRPLMLGYIRIRLDSPAEVERTGREAMSRYAVERGCTLAEVFVDSNENRPDAALAAAIVAARSWHATTILVPDMSHLGRLRNAQDTMRLRIENESGATVVALPVEEGPGL
jgi:hypothetical protein